MNVPTKLTLTRIILTPLFLIVFFLPIWIVDFQQSDLISSFDVGLFNIISVILLFLIFGICELTDFLDGFIARKYNLVTDLGKVLDPFSDVIIRITYFLCFTFVGMMPIWALAIILYREFGILLVRMLSMKRGIAVAANIWGKSKAVLYAVSAILGLAFVFTDRIFLDGFYTVSGLDSAVSQSSRSFADHSLFFLKGVFILSAFVSMISFITYLIPFLKMEKES